MRIFDRLLRPFLILVVLLIFLEVVLEVASRFIFHNPLPWGAEASQTLLVWMTFVGAAAAFLRGEHIGIEMLVERLPRTARKVLIRLNVLIILAFLGYGIRSGCRVVARVWDDVTASLQISAGILYLALPVGFGLMALFGLWMLLTGRERLETERHPS
ncbi:MAG: TRAP transporter small permease [Fretibacterium sp.]|nr:TRAP transporter small permease [Fretibacterium sp.]